jgi:hypothetical protein
VSGGLDCGQSLGLGAAPAGPAGDIPRAGHPFRAVPAGTPQKNHFDPTSFLQVISGNHDFAWKWLPAKEIK